MHNPCSTRSSRLVIAFVVATVAATPNARAGTATGAATEWTQVANNAELIKLLESSGTQVHNQLTQINQLAQQIETQLNIYQNMLQNTATLPEHIWGQVEADINQLRSIVETGQSIAFSMGNADDVLQQRFQNDFGGYRAYDFEQEGLFPLCPLGLFEGLCVFEGCSRLQ